MAAPRRRLARLTRHVSSEPCRGDQAVFTVEGGFSDAVIYLNGKWVPDREALVSIHDHSFIYGMGVFDTTRTYAGRLLPERVQMHLDRFFQSARAMGLENPLSKEEWTSVMEETVRRNQHILEPWGGDFWVFVRLTPGLRGRGGEPTCICEPVPIPMVARAKKYVEGITMNTVGVRRIPPQCVPARMKYHSYVNNQLADMEAQARDPEALALMQDIHGNICEGSSYNFFLVKGGKIFTPREQFALAGISRQTIFDLSDKLGIPCVEKDLDMYDAYNADEAFLTSTSLCLCPVKSINGRPIGEKGALWGVISGKLRDAYRELVGVDFVAQYLALANVSKVLHATPPSAAAAASDV